MNKIAAIAAQLAKCITAYCFTHINV